MQEIERLEEYAERPYLTPSQADRLWEIGNAKGLHTPAAIAQATRGMDYEESVIHLLAMRTTGVL